MSRPLHFILAAVAISALLLAAPGPQLAAQGARDERIALQFQGRARHYLLHIPSSPGAPRALVLAFHGGGQTPEQMQRVTGLDLIADRERFIVAYPEAFERSWADGRNETVAEKQNIDDVAFARAIVKDIGNRHALDRNRIFATGLSNGGILAHRLGCEAAEIFVAIAPVVASMAKNVANTCQPIKPVAVVAIQGRDDPIVRFDGGAVGNRPGSPVLGSRATEALWRSLNGCAPSLTISPLGASTQDGTKVELRVYTGCNGNAEVAWYEIQGGGHRWPPHQEGATEAVARQQNGVSTQNLNASEIIWKFFERHRRR